MHHVHKIEFLNDNQFGFTPQKSTTDVAMTVKQFIEPELERGRVVIMASLDVKGAFDAARWPAILKGLRDAKRPQNFYQLMQDYFRGRRAVISINSSRIERKLRKAVHKGHAADPVFGIYSVTPYLTWDTPVIRKQ
jgi:hypothetical protein